MRKIVIIFVVGLMLTLTGCITVQYPEAAAATAEPVIIVATSDGTQVQYITATPEPATATPTATEKPVSITITNVINNGEGQATVFWESSGDFPNGFMMVWSDTNTAPTFPEDTSTYINDPDKRSAQLQGELGKIYYIRVCRYVDNACDVYSNIGIVGMMTPTAETTGTSAVAATSTKWWTQLTPSYTKTATRTTTPSTASAPYIKITSIQATGPGAAKIYWRAFGDFDNGFLVLYAEGTTVPTYGDYRAYTIEEGYVRSATVTGGFGAKYTFVVCRWAGNYCDFYSAPYTYTFTGITPSPTPD
jgi:hypothetical protein